MLLRTERHTTYHKKKLEDAQRFQKVYVNTHVVLKDLNFDIINIELEKCYL